MMPGRFLFTFSNVTVFGPKKMMEIALEMWNGNGPAAHVAACSIFEPSTRVKMV